MSEYIEEYEFKNQPKKITYFDADPLNLTKELNFFHNKNKFRKELTRLQYLFRDYTGFSLIASGIRDSFLKEEYTEKYLLIIFTDNEIIQKANDMIEKNLDIEFQPGCYYLEANSEYLLLLSKDMKGLVAGVDLMEEIFTQTFKHYFEQNNLNEFIKIRPFKLFNCLNEL